MVNPLAYLTAIWNALGFFYYQRYIDVLNYPFLDWIENKFLCLAYAHMAGANVYSLDATTWNAEAATWSWLRKMRELTLSLVRGHGAAAGACYTAAEPCDILGDAFKFFSDVWNALTVIFFDAAVLWDDIVEKVENVFTWDNIKALILGWLPDLESIAAWWSDWWSEVTSAIATWWSATATTVQGWIDTAKQWAKELIDQVGVLLGTLQEAWDNFKENIPAISEIISWFTNWWDEIQAHLEHWWDKKLLDVGDLIISKLKDWLWFYDDFVDIWEGIKEFFVNPFEWIQTHVIEPMIDEFNRGFDRGMKDEED